MKNQSAYQEYQEPNNVSPSTTINLLKKLSLSNEQFRGIHHFGKRASIQSHIKYLISRNQYRLGGNNEIVAKKLHCIKFLLDRNINNINGAIKKSRARYLF